MQELIKELKQVWEEKGKDYGSLRKHIDNILPYHIFKKLKQHLIKQGELDEWALAEEITDALIKRWGTFAKINEDYNNEAAEAYIKEILIDYKCKLKDKTIKFTKPFLDLSDIQILSKIEEKVKDILIKRSGSKVTVIIKLK